MNAGAGRGIFIIFVGIPLAVIVAVGLLLYLIL